MKATMLKEISFPSKFEDLLDEKQEYVTQIKNLNQ
jgi:hypothetical protein